MSMMIALLILAQDVQLSENGRAMHSIVVAPNASADVKAVAADLASRLGKMGGAEFTVEMGDGSRGLALGRAADFPGLPFKVAFGSGPLEREDYVLRSHPNGVALVGSTDLAVSHAAWDLLYRFGYRQYFPGPVWEVMPPAADLRIRIDERRGPSYHARNIWYDWGTWGYNEQPYRQWLARNRMAKGLDLHSGHAYENIIAAEKAVFDRHPEYFALNGGKRRTQGGDLKFCVSNPGLRALIAQYAVRQMKARPAADSMSMDPSDGDHWCECEPCAQMGSVSDRVLTLANDAAAAINALGLGVKYVGIYAYNRHSAPPKVKPHPRVIVSATTAFITGGFTFDTVVDGWKAAGATMGVYDYLSVGDWDWSILRQSKGSRPSVVAESLASYYKKGIRYYDAQSGDCWGPCGLGHYVASRVLWDVEEAARVEALVEDFVDRSFGAAREPMREFYRLMTEDRQRRPWSDLLGRLYRQLDAARRATSDPKVQARLEHLLLYVRYAELFTSFQAGAMPRDAALKHAFRMRKTMMVHVYAVWNHTLGQHVSLGGAHPLKDETPFTPEELAAMLAEGIAKNQPVDPGFKGVEFTRTLVPATPLKLSTSEPGFLPHSPQELQEFFIWVPQGQDRIDFTVTVQKVWALRQPQVSLYSNLKVTPGPVAVEEGYKPDGKPYELSLRTTHQGLHRLKFLDGGDYTRIRWPQDMPVTLESGIDTPTVTFQFRGTWSLYFYVPKGTKSVGGWCQRIANWAPRVSGKLKDGDGREVLDFAKQEEGWFNAPVAAGQDGRLWKFEHSEGTRLLMTVPPYLARSAGELLLPAEVVQADVRR